MDDFEKYSDVKRASIIYTSLEAETARRRSVIGNVEGKVPFAFVKSIDGRSWSEEEISPHLSDEMRSARMIEIERGKWIRPPGAIANAMTHRNVMRDHLSESGKIIAEDDAVLEKDIFQTIASGDLQSILDRLDGVTLFHYFSRQEIMALGNPIGRAGQYSIYKINPGGVVSAACYFVPKNIAIRIAAFQTPLRSGTDVWGKMIEGGAFESLYAIHPAAARVGDFRSTMEYKGQVQNIFLKYVGRLKFLRRLRLARMRNRQEFYDTITRWESSPSVYRIATKR